MPLSTGLKNAARNITVKTIQRDTNIYPDTNVFSVSLERQISNLNSFIVRDVFIRATQRLVEDDDKIIVIKDNDLVTITVPNGNYEITELVEKLNANSSGIEFMYDEFTMRTTIRASQAKKISVSSTSLSKRLGFRNGLKMINSSTNFIAANASPDTNPNEPVELFIDEISDDPICVIHFDSDGVGFLRKQQPISYNGRPEIKTMTVKLFKAFSGELYKTHGCDFLFSFSYM